MNFPGAHNAQTAVLFTDAMLPGKQARQTLAELLPGTGLALPASQLWHEVLLDAPLHGFQVPGAHGTKTCRIESAPGVGQNPPDGQSAHSVAPAISDTVPAAQMVQLVLALAALNVPGEQGMQLSIVRAPGTCCLVPG